MFLLRILYLSNRRLNLYCLDDLLCDRRALLTNDAYSRADRRILRESDLNEVIARCLIISALGRLIESLLAGLGAYVMDDLLLIVADINAVIRALSRVVRMDNVRTRTLCRGLLRALDLERARNVARYVCVVLRVYL